MIYIPTHWCSRHRPASHKSIKLTACHHIYDMTKTGVIFPNSHWASCYIQNVLQILHAYFMTTVYCSVIIYFQKKLQKSWRKKKKKTVLWCRLDGCTAVWHDVNQSIRPKQRTHCPQNNGRNTNCCTETGVVLILKRLDPYFGVTPPYFWQNK